MARSGGNSGARPASSSWLRVMFVKTTPQPYGKQGWPRCCAVGVLQDGELGTAQLVDHRQHILAGLPVGVGVDLDLGLAPLDPMQLDLVVVRPGDLAGIPALDLEHEQPEVIGQESEVGVTAGDLWLIPGGEVVRQGVAQQGIEPLLAGGRLGRAGLGDHPGHVQVPSEGGGASAWDSRPRLSQICRQPATRDGSPE